MAETGTVEATNTRKRLAAIELKGGRHAVIEWVGSNQPFEGDVVSGYLDSFGLEYLEDRTRERLIKANVRFIGCSKEVAIALVDAGPAH